MSSAIARMLDANANRAREALRVMEDVARFALNDAELTGELKSIRHELRSIVEALPAGWLPANRDTPGDVGTTITTAAEMQRHDLADIAIAAGKRLTEALRVMEEACKTIDGRLAAGLESLRYRAYAADATLQTRLGTTKARQWRVCVLLTRSLCKRPWRDVVQASIDHGAQCIQIREKDMTDGQLLRHAEQVVAMTRAASVAVIINDRVDIALAAGADGVHFGTDDLPIAAARKIAGRSLVIGASTHDLAEAQTAVEAGADYCGIGAMFASSLKPERQPSGVAYLEQFLQAYPRMVHLAIGGITLENINQLVDAGARGVAVSSCVCTADDPGPVVSQLVSAFQR